MRSVADNIVETLITDGLLPLSNVDRAKRVIEQLTKPDFNPDGPPVHRNQLSDWRLAPSGYRCCVQTGEDIQSGPYYCGKPAEAIADVEGKDTVVAACRGHLSHEQQERLGLT